MKKADKEHTHTLSKDAKLTLDGKTCKAEDLKGGLKIRVTTKSTDAKAATSVEAISKNALFANKAVICIEAIVKDGDFAQHI